MNDDSNGENAVDEHAWTMHSDLLCRNLAPLDYGTKTFDERRQVARGSAKAVMRAGWLENKREISHIDEYEVSRLITLAGNTAANEAGWAARMPLPTGANAENCNCVIAT